MTDVIEGSGHYFVGYSRDQEILLRNPKWMSVPLAFLSSKNNQQKLNTDIAASTSVHILWSQSIFETRKSLSVILPPKKENIYIIYYLLEHQKHNKIS